MTTAADNTTTPPTARHHDGVLVDPAWLAAHLRDPDVRVVEVDVSAGAYDAWHIDGAVLWNVYRDLKDRDYRTVGSARVQELWERSGIGPDTTVVLYGYAPALGFWLLKLYGHGEARILDCRRDTWKEHGYPVSTKASSNVVSVYPLGDEDLTVRAPRQAVGAAIARDDTTVVDVRSEPEFRGECFWPSGAMEPGALAGHIPSAVHQPIDGLYDEKGAFRPAADLRRVFSSIDLDRDTELITYCTIGGRAATAWFVLTHLLGRGRVRVYDGSWAEWGRTPDAAVETPGVSPLPPAGPMSLP